MWITQELFTVDRRRGALRHLLDDDKGGGSAEEADEQALKNARVLVSDDDEPAPGLGFHDPKDDKSITPPREPENVFVATTESESAPNATQQLQDKMLNLRLLLRNGAFTKLHSQEDIDKLNDDLIQLQDDMLKKPASELLTQADEIIAKISPNDKEETKMERAESSLSDEQAEEISEEINNLVSRAKTSSLKSDVLVEIMSGLDEVEQNLANYSYDQIMDRLDGMSAKLKSKDTKAESTSTGLTDKEVSMIERNVDEVFALAKTSKLSSEELIKTMSGLEKIEANAANLDYTETMNSLDEIKAKLKGEDKIATPIEPMMEMNAEPVEAVDEKYLEIADNFRELSDAVKELAETEESSGEISEATERRLNLVFDGEAHLRQREYDGVKDATDKLMRLMSEKSNQFEPKTEAKEKEADGFDSFLAHAEKLLSRIQTEQETAAEKFNTQIEELKREIAKIEAERDAVVGKHKAKHTKVSQNVQAARDAMKNIHSALTEEV
ncbi:MAG: hypothetical protein NTW50_05125 [Candidatus Berkelbacteria bacterium]|nr:hypothetical protein [Candidatus Berkelbacteria bacterium]